MSLKEANAAFAAIRKAEVGSKRKSDATIVKLRKSLEAGETTGNPIRDYCLYHHDDRDAADVLGRNLTGIDSLLKKHSGELVLAVEYHAKSNPTNECTWRLGLLDGKGLRFLPAGKKGAKDRSPLDVSVRAVADDRRSLSGKNPILVWESLYPVLVKSILRGVFTVKRSDEDKGAKANLIIGNAAVITWFKRDGVPYNIFMNNKEESLVRAVLNLGQTIANIEPLQAWLQKTRKSCIEELDHAVRGWQSALTEALFGRIHEDEKQRSERRAHVSSDDVIGSRFPEPIPTAQQRLTSLRDAYWQLSLRMDMARDIGIEKSDAWKLATDIVEGRGKSRPRELH